MNQFLSFKSFEYYISFEPSLPCFTSHYLNGLTCEVEREHRAAAGGPGEDLHGGLHEGRLGLGGLLGGGGGHEGGQHEEAGGGHGGGGWTRGHGGD